ncbi:hypothetical protein CN085_21455 [Sinorhizobium meliloti]|uniref:hypothetical protein n=1 Tax=Rhizobium meliloti TaxID=382 RepID=UPI000B4A0886|nr:hypothetical protein [Sinorhizobium meliloti]ASP74444.1 hypothetical protein CDO28_23995 [Sinorhizobium meliloti]MDE3857547.1 hypothetical protein [Sinorhizobium meliloti]MQW52256.1 hypothetical protein [Sinorhizobium meliloti]RVI57051.1 hypothetical protein CN189_28800 [Sinorhizobium meliloti]RVP12792.1 hypothetical protein CN085_21455 [Sinorhizobium meliloti]
MKPKALNALADVEQGERRHGEFADFVLIDGSRKVYTGLNVVVAPNNIHMGEAALAMRLLKDVK